MKLNMLVKLYDNPPDWIAALKLGWQALRNLITAGKVRVAIEPTYWEFV